MAELTMQFFIQKFHLDIVKIMPDLPYPEPGTPLTEASQLRSLPRLGLETTMFQQQLVCIRTLRSQLGNEYPLILTLFSPLTCILRWMGKPRAEAEARKDPESFQQGLSTVSDNCRE